MTLCVICEYNDNIEEIPNPRNRCCKEKNAQDEKVTPDIVIHHRGTKENLLIIEAKPFFADAPIAKKIKEDKDTIIECMKYKKLKYEYGCFVYFDKNVPYFEFARDFKFSTDDSMRIYGQEILAEDQAQN